MAVSDANLDLLRVSSQFIGRVRIAVINYAIWLQNENTTGAKGNWAAEIASQPAAVENWTFRMLPFVLINVAQGSTITGSGATLDIAATDAVIRGQIVTQIENIITE